MAFDRESLAAYEQQPQEMVEIPVVAVEVAADAPAEPAGEADTPAADTSGADDTASGESSADDLEGDTATPSGEPSAATDAPAKGSARARIMELVDERNSYREFGTVAQRENERLRAELAALKGEKPAASTTPAAEPATDTAAAADAEDPPPSPEDPDVMFDPVKLQAKNVKWMREQIAKGVSSTVAKAQTETATKAAVAEVATTFENRVKAYEATDAGKDLRTLLSNKDLPQLDVPARALIVKDPLAPQILHELAKDVTEAKRIAALPAPEQLVEVGEIRARVRAAAKAAAAAAGDTTTTPAAKPATPAAKPATPAAKPAVKQPKTVTSAPPPPTRVPAGAAPNTEKSLSDSSLSMEEFVKRDREAKAAAREEKRKARLGMR